MSPIKHLIQTNGDPVRNNEKLSAISQEIQHLLLSSFPWVRGTVDRQQATV